MGFPNVVLNVSLLKAWNYRPPRVHGNGFIQLDLNDQWRMHFWSDAIPRQDPHTPIHDHVFGFTSWILKGSLTQVEYVKARRHEAPAQPFNAYTYQSVARGGRGFDAALEKINGPRTWLREGVRSRFHAGESYTMAPLEIHETIAHGPSVSLIQKDAPTFQQGGPAPTIYSTRMPDNRFRREGFDSAFLWRLIADILEG